MTAILKQIIKLALKLLNYILKVMVSYTYLLNLNKVFSFNMFF